MMSLTAQQASAFAQVALHNVRQEYPNKLDHVMNDGADVVPPRSLHPVFYGSYDWHSCVHMHWLLVRLLRSFPSLPEAPRIVSTLTEHFTETAVAGEIAYLQQPSRASFERTYGWAWLLKLQTELIAVAALNAKAQVWRDTLQPLAETFAERYLHFLPQAQYPIRAGTHANSAFGLLFALDYAECTQHSALHDLIVEKARFWFGADRRYPAAYEPSGDDFLSAGLMEAALMKRMMGKDGFAAWWQEFFPDRSGLQVWLSPVAVSNRSDPKLAHLDGLNLSRAWCWRLIAGHLPDDLHAPVEAAIEAHLQAALPHVCSGSYAGTHWLASFALLALGQE